MSLESSETLIIQSGIQFEKIGEVDVDSGQILLIDPGYIDSRWKCQPFEDIRIYRNLFTGQQLEYRKDFQSYEDIIPGFGCSMNVLKRAGGWSLEQLKPGPDLSANNCALATQMPARAGVVGRIGTVLETALGDGRYSVYAQRDPDGAILRVLLDLNPPSDEDDE